MMLQNLKRYNWKCLDSRLCGLAGAQSEVLKSCVSWYWDCTVNDTGPHLTRALKPSLPVRAARRPQLVTGTLNFKEHSSLNRLCARLCLPRCSSRDRSDLQLHKTIQTLNVHGISAGDPLFLRGNRHKLKTMPSLHQIGGVFKLLIWKYALHF